MTDLRALMELVTDEIESPDLARSALAGAHRHRNRRRSAVAAVAAGVAIGGVIVVPRLLDAPPDGTLPSERPTPTPAPDPSPSTDEGAIAPAIPEDVIQREWDPATAGSLSYYAIAGLPEVLVPEGSGSTPGDSTGPLVLARSDSDELSILYGDRAWFGLEGPREVGTLWDSSLSRDGARMAVLGEGGLFWCPAAETCPSWTRVEVPGKALENDARITWTRDSSRLIVTGFRGGYEVDLDSGDLTERGFLGGDTAFDVAPDGHLVTRAVESSSIVEFDGSTLVASGRTPDLGSRTRLSAYEDAVAATRTTDEGDGLIVLDRDHVDETRSFLPLTGEAGQWVDRGQIKPLQWLNKVTVLVSVLVDDEVHLVTWDIHTGSKSHVASYPASYDVSLRDLYPA